MTRLATILQHIECYIDDGDAVDLDAALRAVADGPLDIAALLDRAARIKGDEERRRRAIAALRRALRLPVVPGPVCRTRPG